MKIFKDLSIKFLIVSGIWLSFLSCSCSKSGEPVINDPEPENKTEYVTVNLGGATGVKVQAVGVELDPHFYSQNVVGKPDASKEADWEIVVDRVRRMGVQRLRVMVQPQWFEPYNDNNDPMNTDFSAFHWNTIEMQSLYKVLEMAQSQNIDVCLVVWGCPKSVAMVEKEKYPDITTCFMTDPAGTNWVTPPTNKDEFGENFAALVSYLRNEKGYTCVNEVTPFNEPDGNVCELEPYIEICKVLDKHFKRMNIRDKVKFNLSDNTDTRRFYLEGCAAGLKGIADLFNSHTYIFGYETPNSEVQSWERANVEVAKRAGLNHMVGEFGSNQCVGATRQKDIDLYLRGVLMTRHVLNFFNAGACGVSYWSLIDQYYHYNDGISNMQQLGLWRYLKRIYRGNPIFETLKEDYQCRDQYYAYAMLTQNIRPGADIYPIDLSLDFANATAFKDEEGKWVYVIANQEEKQLALAIANNAEGSFDFIRYKEDELPATDALLKPYMTKDVAEGSLKVIVEPHTVLVCRQK